MKKILANRLMLLWPWLASALSAGAMLVPYWNGNFFWLSWIGLVPWLLGLAKMSWRQAYFSGLLFGSIFAIGCSYWVLGFLQHLHASENFLTVAMAALYWGYCAQIPALTAVIFVWTLHRLPHLAWLTPAVYYSLLCATVPTIFPANFAISQTYWPLVLQPLQITGELGLHACILFFNGFLFELTVYKKKIARPSVAIGSVFLILWFGGAYWLWSATTLPTSTLKVGLVQPDYPALKNIPEPDHGYSRAYSPELEISRKLSNQQAQLIIWPELRFTGYYTHAEVRDAIHALVKHQTTTLLLQDLYSIDGRVSANVSVAVSQDKSEATYYKQIKIPFGEYLPFGDWPTIGPVFKTFFSGLYTPLETPKASGNFRVAGVAYQPFICYESVAAIYISDYLATLQEHPAFLILQSNNSWFGRSIQPRLHTASGVLRAVEQQLPLIHAMNNGPSTVTSARGELLFSSEPHKRAGYLLEFPYQPENSPTFFNRYPSAFIYFLWVIAIGHCVAACRRTRAQP